jgi:hypothetical protein
MVLLNQSRSLHRRRDILKSGALALLPLTVPFGNYGLGD